MTSRSRTFLRNAGLGISTLAVSATMVVAAPTAQADPPLTVDEAQTQVSKLETEASAIGQEYAGVKEELEKGRAALSTKSTDVKEQTEKVAKMKAQVGRVALAQFQNRNIDTTAQLFFTEDTSGFLSQISTVEKVSENQNTVLQSFQREQAALADLKRSSETDLADLKAKKKRLKELRAASEKKVEESKAVLSRLTEVERKRLEAEEAEKAAKAQKAAEATSATSTDQSSNDSTSDDSTGDQSSSDDSSTDDSNTDDSNTGDSASDQSNSDDSSSDNSNSDNTNDSRSDQTSRSGGREASTSSSGSSKGQTAMAFARNQIGKPYSFGATGPGSYDCSGLTGAAWKAAGVSLSRTSQSQFNDGTSVSKSELQPGDLVFYYSGLSHVGLYAGNGQILHAPRPGKSVEYAGLDSMPFVGARRPG